MISKLRSYRVEEKVNIKKLMPPLLMRLIIVFIICFIVFARALANPDHKETSIPVWSTVSGINQEVRAETEEDVVNYLSKFLRLLELQENGKRKEVLYGLLLNKLRDRITDMPDENLELLFNRVTHIQMILDQEKRGEFMNMSLEGRQLILYIFNDIFELSGFQVTINLDGEIEKITDSMGVLMYSHAQTDLSGIQGKELVIVLSIILLALLVCILIAKKNQLFRKEVAYDGLNKKQYA